MFLDGIEISALSEYRKNYGFGPESALGKDAKRFIDAVFPSLENDALTILEYDPQRPFSNAMNLLELARIKLQSNLVNSVSKPNVCSFFVMNTMGMNLYTQALDSFKRKDRAGLTYFFDIGSGVNVVAAYVGLAARFREGNGEPILRRMRNPGVDSMEMIIMGQKGPEVADNAVRLLDRDNGRGFVLVDEYVEMLKGRVGISKADVMGIHQIPEFFIAGAAMGAKLYKASYNLAGKLPDVEF